MNLLIIGAPGVGKGTMSNLLIQDYKLVHVSTGDMLRAAIKNETPVGKLAQQYMEKGQLVPDEVIHNIIVERLSQDDIKQGFLFDGYPRTKAQAIDLDKILSELNLKIEGVLNLQIDDEVVVKRITGRRTCPKCGTIYNIYYGPSKQEGICDKCGSELSVRKDDNEESLKERLQEFHKNTQPVVDYYRESNLVYDLNADQSIESVYGSIKAVLEGIK